METPATPPTGSETDRLKLRSDLASAIAAQIRRQALTQAKAAALLGISQPRLNAVLNGRVELFSLDSLVGLAQRSGLNVAIRVTRPYAHTAR